MLKTVAIALCLTVAACAVHDPNDVAGQLTREFEAGEKLMNDCNNKKKNCPKWFQFKKDWEAELNNYVTFEVALERHKARVAQGLAV